MRLLVTAISVLVLLGAVLVPRDVVADSARIDLPVGFAPEGIAVGRGHTFFTGSFLSGAIYRGDVRTGEGAILVPDQGGRGVLGMTVDSRNRLFVAGGFTGDAYVYDGGSGALLRLFHLADAPTVVNDVVLTRNAAWFTDSSRAVLYRVPIAPNGGLGDPATVSLSGDFVLQDGFNLNGIVATPNEDWLIVVQSNTGTLFRVNPESGVTDEIDLGGDDVAFGDGLLLRGRTLYVVQNFSNQIAKLELSQDFGSATVVSRSSDPSFDIPTTVALFGDTMLLPNLRFFSVPDPSTGQYWITKIMRP